MEFITIGTLSKRLKVSTGTVHRWRKQGLPVAIERNGFIRLDYDSVLKWLMTKEDEQIKVK